MDLTLERYWRAVQHNVCSKCIDGDGSGNCRLSAEDECGVRPLFPGIVETVLATHSDGMEPYIEALRQNVCVRCKHQTVDGSCSYRTHLDCGLDRYFPLVVDAIEEVRREGDPRTDAPGNEG